MNNHNVDNYDAVVTSNVELSEAYEANEKSAKKAAKQEKKANKKAKKEAKKAKKAAKKKRLRTRWLGTLIKSLILFAILGAVAYAVVGFVTKDVYADAPDGAIEVTDGLLSFTNEYTLDLSALTDHLLYGAVYGLAAGLVLGLLLIIVRAIAEGCRFRRVADVREVLNGARHIRTESFAKIKAFPHGVSKVKKCRKKGTLFLTDVSLEFYGKKFKKAKNNHLIKLSAISFVQKKSKKKLFVFTNEGKYVLRVQKGTAKRWKKALVRAVNAK